MKAAVQSFRDLIVWQKAMQFVEDVYRASASFPVQEAYGLTSQLRRSAVSVPSNIAEGNGRGATTDYRRFLCIARGSLFEAQTQIELAQRLDYLPSEPASRLLNLANEMERMLHTMLAKLSH